MQFDVLSREVVVDGGAGSAATQVEGHRAGVRPPRHRPALTAPLLQLCPGSIAGFFVGLIADMPESEASDCRKSRAAGERIDDNSATWAHSFDVVGRLGFSAPPTSRTVAASLLGEGEYGVVIVTPPTHTAESCSGQDEGASASEWVQH